MTKVCDKCEQLEKVVKAAKEVDRDYGWIHSQPLLSSADQAALEHLHKALGELNDNSH